MSNERIDNYSIMIASKYFESIDDFINLELAVKRFKGNMGRFHFNPIALNDFSRKLFTDLETLNLYSRDGRIFKDGKIFKQCIWNRVSYSTYLEEKEKGNECKFVVYSRKDRKTYGNEIPTNIKIIGDHCFRECESITTIVIPETVREIKSYCFYSCESIMTIEIPTTVSYLGDYCFGGCSQLKGKIKVPERCFEKPRWKK